ncbi:lantibiotic dehydratase [Amycolatopsis sp. A1MSW2902]|uniref:lantibiotic dehydratase n=1 Tax=Amycolatopsis sp. A1MSW2902 TaxID=687413 RepID=UPI00307F2D3A
MNRDGSSAMTSVVRVSALPPGVLRAVRFERTDALVSGILAAEEELGRTGRLLADRLHALIGSGGTRPPDRRELLEARRTLHQGKTITARRWCRIEPLLEPALRALIGHWRERHAELAASRSGLPALMAGELPAKAAELLRLTAVPEVAHSLAAASPPLYDAVERWRDEPWRLPKQRKLARLMTYVARAAVKTSPFSFFTSQRPGRWSEMDDVVRLGVDEATGVVEVDGEYLEGLGRALTARAELDGELRLSVNPSVTVVADRVEFLGRPPREDMLRMELNPVLAALLGILATRPSIGRREAAALLAVKGRGHPDAADRFIGRAIDRGLVETALPVPELSADWLGDCARLLRTVGTEPMTSVGDHLAAAALQVRRHVRPGQVAAHRARCAAVRAELAAVEETLGDGPVLGRPAILFETSVSRWPAELGSTAWRGPLADLDLVRRWLAVFDPQLPRRLAVAAFHAERFGDGSTVGLLTLHLAIRRCTEGPGTGRLTAAEADLRMIFRAGDGAARGDIALAGAASARLREVARLRAEARAFLRGDRGSGLMELEDVRARLRDRPGWIDMPGSAAFYVQPVEVDGRAHVVLNAAHAGYGRSAARLDHLLTRVLGHDVTFDQGEREDFVELEGRFGSTLNVHAPSSAGAVRYPFTAASEAGVKISDIEVAHSAADGTLRLRESGGRRIVPIHRGLMSADYLPGAARFLVQAFGADWLFHPGALALVPFEDLTPASTSVTYPRATLGSVILRRRGCLVEGGLVPARVAGEADAGYLLRLHRWFRAHELPSRCFVRVWNHDGTRIRGRTAKPLFVDLANWFLVLAFERLVSTASLVLFEEVLPDLDGDDGRTIEVAVEVPARGLG